MACDSLYAAWLKVHYPYELYVTMLKLYDEKKNTDKISAIISEMKRYKDIKLTAGRFGQDNRDWVVDKERGTISQSLSSIRYMSKKAAQDLQRLGQNKYETFTDLLRDLQMDSCLDTRQTTILIELNYFKPFGRSGKLMKVFDRYYNGENNLSNKNIKSFAPRLEACREFERSLDDDELPISQRLRSELSNVGLCLSTDKTKDALLYFAKEIDAKYGIKVTFYSVQRGTSGVMRIRKDLFAKQPFEEGNCVLVESYDVSPKYTYRGGEKVELPGEKDIWIKKYKVLP